MNSCHKVSNMVQSVFFEEDATEIKAHDIWNQHGQSLPYFTFIEAFRNIMNRLERDGKAEKICNGRYRIKPHS